MLVTVRDLQRREVAARQAATEAGQNATGVATVHSELNQKHEELKAELQRAQEQVTEAQRRVEVAEKLEREAVEATDPHAMSGVLKVANRHLGSQEVERKRLVDELQSLHAQYDATLPAEQVKDLIRARDSAREKVLELTEELKAARGTVKELGGTNQRLVDECQQQLQARESAPADPHAAERLRAAEQELQGLKALLEERGRYVALQSEQLQNLEKTKEQPKKSIEELEEQLKQATPTTTAVVALSPQQAMSSLAQFTQAMAQGNTTPRVGSTQGPPAQYFNIPQQPMGVLPGAAPSQQAVRVPAGAASALRQVMTTPNQGYMNPSMMAPYYGSPQVPMILHPPTVPSPAVMAPGPSDDALCPARAVVTTASHPQ